MDLRKSFTGLLALAKPGLGQDPLPGHLLVFINRRGNYLKALYWDRTGFCLWAKRLERRCFVSDWRTTGYRELDVTGLKLLLQGIEPARRRVHYQWRSNAIGKRVKCTPGNRARDSY